MSAEDEEEKLIYEAVLNHFNSRKVEISHAVTSTFPFLHGLRDRGVITDKKFQDAEEACFKKVPVKYVVYNVLGTLEKFDASVFEAVFSELNLQEYPKLVSIHKSFEIEVNRVLRLQNNVRGHIEENSRIQLPLEQVINSEESEELSNEDQLPEASTSTAGGEPELITRPSEALSNGEEPQEATTSSALMRDSGAELHLRGPEHGNCTCVMCCSKGSQEAQTGSNQASDTTGQRRRGNNKQRKPQGSKKGQRRRGNNKQRKPQGQRRRGNNKQRKPQDSKKGTRRVNDDPLKRRRRGGRRIPRHAIAKFKGPELPVECGRMNGILYKNLLQQGSCKKCIQGEDGRYFTLREFEIEGGYETSKNWRQSIRCLGWPLKVLIQKGFLQNPPRSRRKRTQESDSGIFIDPYPENSNECDVCYQGGVMYCCDTCSRSYHQDCHISHIDPGSYTWSCINCRIKAKWHICWKNQPLHQESEVLQIQMQPEEQLKCEYLLLKVYQCSQSTSFASRLRYGTQGPMWLDQIKEKLRRQEYSHVGGFVQDMRLIFQDLEVVCGDEVFLRLGRELEAKFEKNFQRIFAVQETGQSMS